MLSNRCKKRIALRLCIIVHLARLLRNAIRAVKQPAQVILVPPLGGKLAPLGSKLGLQPQQHRCAVTLCEAMLVGLGHNLLVSGTLSVASAPLLPRHKEISKAIPSGTLRVPTGIHQGKELHKGKFIQQRVRLHLVLLLRNAYRCDLREH
jgi:hypothetical protein